MLPKKRIGQKQARALERASYMEYPHIHLEDIGYFLFSPARLPILAHPELTVRLFLLEFYEFIMCCIFFY